MDAFYKFCGLFDIELRSELGKEAHERVCELVKKKSKADWNRIDPDVQTGPKIQDEDCEYYWTTIGLAPSLSKKYSRMSVKMIKTKDEYNRSCIEVNDYTLYRR